METTGTLMTASIAKNNETGKYQIQVIGDTYPHRDGLRAAGYQWNKVYGRWEFAFDATPTAEDAQAALDRLAEQELAEFFPANGLSVFPA